MTQMLALVLAWYLGVMPWLYNGCCAEPLEQRYSQR